MSALAERPRSRLLATWIAILGGSLGLHRFYLHGARDAWGWLYPLPTMLGAYGAWRMRELGVDDRLGGLLVPLLGATLAAALLSAVVHGLTDDRRWAARHAGDAPPRSGWLTVAGVVLAAALGATVTMATIAFVAQQYFERTAVPAR